MARNTFITAEEYAAIAKRVDAGETVNMIAAIVGRSRHGIEPHIARIRAGLPYQAHVGAGRTPAETERQVKGLRKRGHSAPCIAQRCGITDQTVFRIAGKADGYQTCGCLKVQHSGVSKRTMQRRAARLAAEKAARAAEKAERMAASKSVKSRKAITLPATEKSWTRARELAAIRMVDAGEDEAVITRILNRDYPGGRLSLDHVVHFAESHFSGASA